MTETPVRIQEMRITVAIAEFASVRDQIIFSVGRAHRLAVYGVGGAAAALTAIAGFRLGVEPTLISLLLVVAGLAVVALAYVGITGETFQAGNYLLSLGAFVRANLELDALPRLSPEVPLLRFEEVMAGRTRSEPWSVLASSLATFEMGGTIVATLGLLGAALITYVSDSLARTLATTSLLAVDGLFALGVLLSVGVILQAQHRRTRPP